ncbi:MAG: SUMF1/EgtB/PvdO family nonheme iron enzyme [Magnetococcales bacterium]|nr:SUMF1/EgtB/PvdO family nonheme iron enzyme [Magnetococcales bacterium]
MNLGRNRHDRHSPFTVPRVHQGLQLPDQEPRYLRQRSQRRRIFFLVMAALLLWSGWDSMVEWVQRQSTTQPVESMVIPPAFRHETAQPTANLPFHDLDTPVVPPPTVSPPSAAPSPPVRVQEDAPYQERSSAAVVPVSNPVTSNPVTSNPVSNVPASEAASVASSLSRRKCTATTSGSEPAGLLVSVAKGDYLLKNLKKGAEATEVGLFLKAAGLERAIIKEPFAIQTGEVTVAEFQEFVQAVQQWPDGPDKQEVLMHIGPPNRWLQANPAQSQLHPVSWEAAQDYLVWLNRGTGCQYQLPSREQWAAAVLSLASKSPSAPLLHSLLRGVREWSTTRCPGGYVLLGEEDNVATGDIGRSSCMPAMVPIAGFRVVLEQSVPQSVVPQSAGG